MRVTRLKAPRSPYMPIANLYGGGGGGGNGV